METSFLEGFKIPFREYVLKDLEIASYIDDRFIGGWLATFYTDEHPPKFPLATFVALDGPVRNQNIIQQFPLVINCYSNQHYDECWEIDKAIMDICGGANGPVYINQNIIIRPNSTGSEMYDEEARLYGVSRRYLVTYLVHE